MVMEFFIGGEEMNADPGQSRSRLCNYLSKEAAAEAFIFAAGFVAEKAREYDYGKVLQEHRGETLRER